MAEIGNKFGLGGGGPVFGAPFLGYDTGLKYPPHYVVSIATALTTTATRAYYIPYFVGEAITFSAIATHNSGAGDNGDTYRLAVYANNGTAGPGTLIQDIGQVTLTGASTLRTLSATINLTAYASQWVWVMFHANQAAAMYDMRLAPTSYDGPTISTSFGTFGALDTNGQQLASFRYVDTAYGAAASTAVAPTDSVSIAPVVAFVK